MTQQTTDTGEQTAIVQPGNTGPTRDELVAALDGIDLDAPDPGAHAEKPPAGDAGVPPPTTGQPAGGLPPPAAPPAEPDIVRLVRERDAREADRLAKQSDGDRLLAEARAQADRIIEEARQRADTEARATRDQFARDLRERPLATIKGSGIDANRLVSDVVSEESPEFRRTQALETEARAAREDARKATETSAATQKAIEAQDQRIAAWHRSQLEDQAVSIGAAQAPKFMAAVNAAVAAQRAVGFEVDARTIFLARAHAAADIIKASNGVASPANVVQYLEWWASQPATGAQAAPGTEGAGSPGAQGAPTTAATGKANGTSRTLSAAGASERRSQPKPLDELSARDARAELAAIADEVLRAK